MKNIVSEKLYLHEVEGYIRYYVDEDNIYWYNYDELTDMLSFTTRAKDDIYKHLNNNEKIVYNDSNYINGESKWSRFITTNMLSMIINRNNKRANNILKTIINNESTVSIDYIEFENELKYLEQKLQSDDYVGIVQSIRDISISDTFKDTLCKYDRSYKRENEDLIDEFRNYIYDAYYDDIQINVKLTKRKDNELDEEKEIKYKRNKDKKSTCPSWLKEIVK